MNLGEYRRDYYRKKYHTDADFREMKKTKNRNHYKRLTVTCKSCGERRSKASLDKENIPYEDDNFYCNKCPQIIMD